MTMDMSPQNPQIRADFPGHVKVYAPFPFFQEFKNFLMIEAWSRDRSFYASRRVAAAKRRGRLRWPWQILAKSEDVYNKLGP